MDINIIRDHEVIKSNLKKGIKYFGEISSDNVPTGIGLINVDDVEIPEKVGTILLLILSIVMSGPMYI